MLSGVKKRGRKKMVEELESLHTNEEHIEDLSDAQSRSKKPRGK